jgi:molybdopterin synthase sulfur carrier subunit
VNGSAALHFLQGLWQESILVRKLLANVFIDSKEVVFMPVRVRVPTPLRKFTQGVDEVNAQGANVKALVEDLDKNFPGIKERICDETGKIRRFVNVYVNGDDIRFLQNLETALKEGDNISIVPAIAGGH